MIEFLPDVALGQLDPDLGREDEDLAVRAVRSGAQDYLVKGQVDGNLLVRAMRYAVERQKSEVALRQSEARFRDLFDAAPIGYHELNLEGRITRVNRTELAMLGFAANEMLGREIWDFEKEDERAQA
ncbi:MAG: PAS domain S-box protein, partial [Planctomycetes bacterium]|nr:PAS domain S-box protein [Planctomycetota bacterium]